MNQRLQGIGMTSLRTRNRMIDRLHEQGIRSDLIFEIMSTIPRHIFIDEALASRAYEDNALPIGFNQTISQPYIVAKMTELLIADNKPSKVLEIGTGCGYQTAILAKIADKVYSVERILPLKKKAQQHLLDLQLGNISLKHSDGSWGWAEHSPYDGIIVTAAPAEIPQKLLEQLSVGGVMIIPIGRRNISQVLHKITRKEDGYVTEKIESVSFVPFLSGKS